MDHLVGTPMLKPYMHGYFISLKLYDAARVIANPFAYAEHREKIVREKMEKMAETRIRSRKDAGVKVNKALAEKILKEEERAKKREERKKAKKAAAAANAEEDGEDVGMEDVEDESATQKLSLLSDPRFAKVFEDPEFAIDENSREYALLNPSSVAQRREKTAVEDEEDESDKTSSDGLGDSDSENGSNNDSNSSEDSSDAGGMSSFLCADLFPLFSITSELQPHVRTRVLQKKHEREREVRVPRVNLVPMNTQGTRGVDKNASFGQHLINSRLKSNQIRFNEEETAEQGEMEMTWTPSSTSAAMGDIDDNSSKKRGSKDLMKKRKGTESFGVGMERGGMDEVEIKETEKKGRTQRRKGIRSGSRNVFRNLGS